MKKQVGRLVLVGLLMAAVLSGLTVTAFAETKPVELHFLGWFAAELHQKYVDFANDYMKKHHPNVTVVGTSTDGTGQNYNAKVMVSIAAGAGPDIYLFNLSNFDPSWVEQYNMMLPLDSLLNKDPRYKNDIPPALLNAWSYNGTLYGLPTTIGQYAIYYNKNHFAQSGLPTPPANWTIQGDFVNYIKKLAVFKPDGKLERYGLPFQNGLQGRFMNYIMSNGGHVVDEAVTRARTNEKEFVEIVELFKDMIDSNLIVRSNTSQAYERFVSAQASMLMTGIFYQSRVQQYANFDWGIARIPAGKAGRITVANTNAWVVNPQGKNVELAWELAKAFSSAEFTEYALKEGLEFPVALSALRRYFYATLPPNLTRAEGDIWLEAMDYIRPFPKHPLMNDIWSAVNGQLNQVWNNRQSPSNALNIAAEQINGIIATAKK